MCKRKRLCLSDGTPTDCDMQPRGTLLRGGRGNVVLMYTKMGATEMEWLLDAGKFIETYLEDKARWERTHMHMPDNREGVRAFPGYAATDHADRFEVDCSEPLRDGSDVEFDGLTDSASRPPVYMYFQCNRDFIKAYSAPVRLQIWLRAFRRVNSTMLTRIASRVAELDNPLGRTLADVIRKAGSAFAAVSMHYMAADDPNLSQERNDSDRRQNWHVDAVTSLLHLSVTLKGRRTLGIRGMKPVAVAMSEGTHLELRLEPGDVYMGNAAAYEHGVYDRELGAESLNLQCRLGFRWQSSAQHRVGFDIYGDGPELELHRRQASDAIEKEMRKHELRLPHMADLAEVAANVSWGEHGWFYHNSKEAMRVLGWEGALGEAA